MNILTPWMMFTTILMITITIDTTLPAENSMRFRKKISDSPL